MKRRVKVRFAAFVLLLLQLFLSMGLTAAAQETHVAEMPFISHLRHFLSRISSLREELPAAETVPDTEEGDLFRLINQERERRGLAPFIWCNATARASYSLLNMIPFSTVLEEAGISAAAVSNTRSDGQTPQDAFEFLRDDPWGIRTSERVFMSSLGGHTTIYAGICKHNHIWHIGFAAGIEIIPPRVFEQFTAEQAYERLSALRTHPDFAPGPSSIRCYWFARQLLSEAFDMGFVVVVARSLADDILTLGTVIKPGDTIWYESGYPQGHVVVVLEVDGDIITVAEGNFNYSIVWGRTLTRQYLIENNGRHVATRYSATDMPFVVAR